MLTITPLYADEQCEGDVTGYDVQCSNEALRQQEITLVALSLYRLVPLSLGGERQTWEIQVMAAVSLRLVALLEGGDADRSMQAIVRDALHGINFYLTRLRNVYIDTGVSEAEANARVTPGFAYFEYDWDAQLEQTTP